MEKDMEENVKFAQKIFKKYLGQDSVPSKTMIRQMIRSLMSPMSMVQSGGSLLKGFTPLITANDHSSAITDGPLPAGDYNKVVEAHNSFEHPVPPEVADRACGGPEPLDIAQDQAQVPIANDGNFPGLLTEPSDLAQLGGKKKKRSRRKRRRRGKRTRSKQRGGALSFFPVHVDTNARFPGITEPTDPVLGFTSKVTENIDSMQKLADGETTLNTDYSSRGHLGLSGKSSAFASKDISVLNDVKVFSQAELDSASGEGSAEGADAAEATAE